jgi:NAD(P)-dependent dehydrogenase (short-subunit alcohol dehydrogenase family)
VATWLITGCSSGLGRALALAVLDRGENVIVTARNVATVTDLAASHPDTALALGLDMTDRAQIAQVARCGESRFGGIDVLVNNAGHGYRAAVEEGEEDRIAEVFETNFFGPAALIRAVLPGMRERRGGTIVNVSSGGARSYPIGAGYYVASKAALEAVTACLRKEVEPHGITAIMVEPGAFRTNYKLGVSQVREPIGGYADTVGIRRQADLTEHGGQAGDPARAANAIVAAVTDPHPPLLLVLGADALAWFRDSVRDLSTDVDAWEQTTLGTSYPAVST